jgi:NADH:ubiquinone oxidoreductase subunit E
MSIKQKSHLQAYYNVPKESEQQPDELADEFNTVVNILTDHIEKNEIIENEIIENEIISTEATQIINALEDIMSELKHVKKEDIKTVVDTILTQNDKNEIINLYYTFFDKLPNENTIKIYVLHLMTTLCIPIMKNTDEFNKQLYEYNKNKQLDESDESYESDEGDNGTIE